MLFQLISRAESATSSFWKGQAPTISWGLFLNTMNLWFIQLVYQSMRIPSWIWWTLKASVPTDYSVSIALTWITSSLKIFHWLAVLWRIPSLLITHQLPTCFSQSVPCLSSPGMTTPEIMPSWIWSHSSFSCPWLMMLERPYHGLSAVITTQLISTSHTLSVSR